MRKEQGKVSQFSGPACWTIACCHQPLGHDGVEAFKVPSNKTQESEWLLVEELNWRSKCSQLLSGTLETELIYLNSSSWDITGWHFEIAAQSKVLLLHLSALLKRNSRVCGEFVFPTSLGPTCFFHLSAWQFHLSTLPSREAVRQP